jgi:AraC-like DNA-binding protein
MTDSRARPEVSSEPKGVLDPALAAQKFRLARYEPSALFGPFVQYYWVVAWDLRGQEPHVQKTLPDASVHLVFDVGRTAVFGVMRGAFEYRQQDAGRVLGVRFRPGGFRGWLRAPLATVTDRTLTLEQVLGIDTPAAERVVFSVPDDQGMITAAETLLRPHLPPPDPTVDLVHGIVDRISTDREINRVDDLAGKLGLGTRALQRLFVDYVGVSPKWVIRRQRLHDAAARLAKAEPVNLTRLAQDLGYSDQAHFTREFKAIVGRAPSEYRRSAI